jgi:hypothetical protein
LIREAGAQGRVADPDGILDLTGDDEDLGGHAGFKQEFAVIDANDGVIGDDVVHHARSVADLDDITGKTPVTVGIDLKLDTLANPQSSHIGFGNIGDDLHLGEVISNLEENGCTQAAGHGPTGAPPWNRCASTDQLQRSVTVECFSDDPPARFESVQGQIIGKLSTTLPVELQLDHRGVTRHVDLQVPDRGRMRGTLRFRLEV